MHSGAGDIEEGKMFETETIRDSRLTAVCTLCMRAGMCEEETGCGA